MRNIDKVVDYIIKNTAKLSPEKIQALGTVVGSLEEKDEVTREPNTVEVVENQEQLMENTPLDLRDVKNIQFEGGKPQEIKIH